MYWRGIGDILEMYWRYDVCKGKMFLGNVQEKVQKNEGNL